MTRFRTLAFAMSCVAALAGCSTTTPTPPAGGALPGGTIQCLDPSAQNKVDCKAVIAVNSAETGAPVANGKTIPVLVGNIKNTEFSDLAFTINNTTAAITAAELIIQGVSLEYEAVSPDEDPTAFQCLAGPDDALVPCADLTGKWDKIVPAGKENPAAKRTSALPFRIRYTRYDDQERTATLRIKVGNVPTVSEFVVKFITQQGKPKAVVEPATLTWEYVPAGGKVTRDFTITNGGNALLTIKSLDFAASDVFSLTVDGDPTVHKAGALFVPEPPLQIEAGSNLKVTVLFAPTDDHIKQGKIRVQSNDPSAKDGIPVDLVANSAVPCIILEPAIKLNFGGVLAGQSDVKDVKIKNCGTTELEVYAVEFADGTTTDEFAFDFSKTIEEGSKLPGEAGVANGKVDKAKGPTKTTALRIPKNMSLPVTVRYSPTDVTKGEPPLPDVGVVKVTSSAFKIPTVNVEGIGVLQTCPVAKVSVKEGEEVVPQTALHLKGDASIAPGGAAIKKYKWTVKQPPGSNQPLSPNSSFPNPSLTANAAGEYEFCLDVWDANDAKSCQPACVKVLVVPNNAIHVELLWDTPADPDQTDTGPAAGADLDLHFAHQLASGPDIDCDGQADPWFSNPFDDFWFNPNPNWGSSNPAAEDDPSLDLDDTDGAGPENLNLATPEGKPDDAYYYSLGVHYWNDHGFGVSFATITVYLQGVVSLKIDKVKMDPLDMWYVGKINWPNMMNGAPGLQPVNMCYQTGDACLALTDPTNAAAGKMWKPQSAPKADWCITKCYTNELFLAAAGGASAPSNCKKKP